MRGYQHSLCIYLDTLRRTTRHANRVNRHNRVHTAQSNSSINPNQAKKTNPNRAGVLALSTASYIQPHLTPGQSLLIIARDFPHTTSIDYTSPWAGAHYRPIPGTSAQARREANQARRTYEHFKTLSETDPESGIEFIEGIEFLEAPPQEYLDDTAVQTAYGHLDEFRVLRPEQLPEGVKWGVRYKTFVVNSPVYCAYLLRKLVSRGAQTREYTLSNLDETFSLANNVRAVINCSGMGFGDPKSFIIRGIISCFLFY